ncbi:NAD(P)-binding protein [Pseudohyphozyma bogoriensis]|nr:NAD(P)-binding protein [Pseudohyphozyma bogoriensis]
MSPTVFFITGTSSGFGHDLVKVVLKAGHIAVATSRNPSGLSFDGATEDNFLAVKLDVGSAKSVGEAFETVVAKFGRVDVVVNNAGYGLLGEFESFTEQQCREQFDVNFFGLINVTKKAMQTMRDRKTGGRILQITSIGGQTGVPTASLYCASKWAVEGLTEAIAQEVKPEWGIKFTCVEPGGFRTEWAGGSMGFTTKLSPDPYDHLNAPKTMGARHGTQVGDPYKGAEAMYKIAMLENPPLRVVLGSDAYGRMLTKMETYTKSIKEYEELSKSTDVVE